MTEFLQSLSTLDPFLIYAIIFFISYIENIFPPSPSDVVVVFGGALAAMGQGSFVAALFASTFGSTLGFMTMYAIGKWFGNRILEAGKIKFIPVESVKKVEGWFQRYGYWIIIVNRFLAGTRAVVSFFAGISELNLGKTTLLSFMSSLAWYGILVYAGYSLGRNWEKIGWYLSTYSQIVTGIVIVVVLILIARYLFKRNSSNSSNG
jgi:membrane protein DedA with SNARE-associated domain